jgi:uncharacterized protein (TIGR04376 family)
MGLWEDFGRFLEQQLEEFLQAHPELELSLLSEEVRLQEVDAQQSLQELQRQQQQLETQILSTAQEIQKWHERASKAQTAGLKDLQHGAEERQATLLKQGNQLWQQRQTVENRIQQTQALLQQILVRRQELQQRIQQQTKASPSPNNAGYRTTTNYRTTTSGDPLEDKFRQWELEAELEALKRKMER